LGGFELSVLFEAAVLLNESIKKWTSEHSKPAHRSHSSSALLMCLVVAITCF